MLPGKSTQILTFRSSSWDDNLKEQRRASHYNPWHAHSQTRPTRNSLARMAACRRGPRLDSQPAQSPHPAAGHQHRLGLSPDQAAAQTGLLGVDFSCPAAAEVTRPSRPLSWVLCGHHQVEAEIDSLGRISPYTYDENFDLLETAWSPTSSKRDNGAKSPVGMTIAKATFGDLALQRSYVCPGVLISVFCSIAPKTARNGNIITR